MTRNLNLIFLVLVCMTSTACQSTHKQASEAQADIVPAHCEGLMVSLEEALQLMKGCEIVRLGQPHHGPVILFKEDGSKVCFEQPRLDWVLGYANTACPERPIQTVIE